VDFILQREKEKNISHRKHRDFILQREKEKNISHRKHRDFILQREKEKKRRILVANKMPG